MDELFKLLVPIVVVIYYIVTAVRSSKREEEPLDPEEAERRRKIQEEIRRKILERQMGGTPATRSRVEDPVELVEEEDAGADYWNQPPPEPPRPAATQEPPPLRPAVFEEPVRDYASEVEEQQRRLATQQRKAEAQLATARKRMQSLSDSSRGLSHEGHGPHQADRFPDGAATGSGLRKRLRADLATSTSLKRAFILKEVLDKPVGLR